MEEKWFAVNERIFALEEKIYHQGLNDELRKEWDELVIYSRKIPGCVNRKTYEEQIGQKETEETGDRNNVESVS